MIGAGGVAAVVRRRQIYDNCRNVESFERYGGSFQLPHHEFKIVNKNLYDSYLHDYLVAENVYIEGFARLRTAWNGHDVLDTGKMEWANVYFNDDREFFMIDIDTGSITRWEYMMFRDLTLFVPAWYGGDIRLTRKVLRRYPWYFENEREFGFAYADDRGVVMAYFRDQNGYDEDAELGCWYGEIVRSDGEWVGFKECSERKFWSFWYNKDKILDWIDEIEKDDFYYISF